LPALAIGPASSLMRGVQLYFSKLSCWPREMEEVEEVEEENKVVGTAAPRYLVIRYLGSLAVSYGFAGQVLPFSTKNYLLSRILSIS
jgi:hypothetical protein